MNPEQTIQEIKEQETARFNYSGEVSIRETDKTPCFQGCMDLLTTAKIRLGFNPAYLEETQALEKIVAEPFRKAFRAVLRHELNHKGGGEFQGCPRNIELHAENILEPVAETLQGLGFPNVPVTENQSLYAYMANLVEDVFDNSELGSRSDHLGMFLSYKDDAGHLPEEKEGKFSPLFEGFLQLQQELYGGKRSHKLLREHYSGEEKVREAVNNFLQRTGLSDFQREIVTRRKKEKKQVFDRKRAVRYCMDKENWPELSKILTEEFAKLIDKDKLNQPDYIKITFVPLKGEGDNFSDEMGHPETKMRFAWRKYQKGKEAGNAFQPPAYLDSFEALDLVYQKLARNLEIKTRASTRTASFPVVWYGKRDFDPRRDKLSKARVGLGKRGRLELNVRKYHEDVPVEYTERKGDIPRIRFIKRDDSGSMRLPMEGNDIGTIMNPWADKKQQWGDNSRYHGALVGEWGLYELLRKQGALKHTSVKSISYSYFTRIATNLREAKKQALSPSFGRDTLLDMEKINQLFSRDELVISISDGDIHNWDDWLVEPEEDEEGNIIKEGIKVSDEYIKRAKQNHYFHLQIGNFTKDEKGNILDKPEMCLELEAAGLPVFYDNGKNLGKLVIDLTRPYITRGKPK